MAAAKRTAQARGYGGLNFRDLAAEVGIDRAQALDALEEDHEFLLAGDVFTEDLIETYINYKVDNEIMPTRLRPTPQEFEMYFDC